MLLPLAKGYGKPRRLCVALALDVIIQPSTEATATSSSGDAALNAQAAELGNVSSNLESLRTTPDLPLAAAAGGPAVITELESLPNGAPGLSVGRCLSSGCCGEGCCGGGERRCGVCSRGGLEGLRV